MSGSAKQKLNSQYCGDFNIIPISLTVITEKQTHYFLTKKLCLVIGLWLAKNPVPQKAIHHSYSQKNVMFHGKELSLHMDLRLLIS